MIVERLDENPVLKPKRNHLWEAQAVFNGCPVKKGENILLLYRALSLPYYHALSNARLSLSSIGIARSKDGVHFAGRRRFIFPEYSWERFGCEDPRVTKFNHSYYIFYTALSTWPPTSEGIKVGLAISKDLKRVNEKHPVTPFNAKAMALFPQRIGGKIYAILTVHTDRPPVKVCLAAFDKEEDIWSESYWQVWYKDFEKYALPLQRRPEDFLEVGAPPLRTKDGWLLLHSYIQGYLSEDKETLFGVEAVLLDLEDPFKILARSELPLLIPEEYYERIGLVPNVVFPSGALVRRGRLYIYYGAADTTCCVASVYCDCSVPKRIPLFSRSKSTLGRARQLSMPVLYIFRAGFILYIGRCQRITLQCLVMLRVETDFTLTTARQSQFILPEKNLNRRAVRIPG